MKKFVLMALVLGVYSMPSSATEVNTDHLMFPEDVEAAYNVAYEQAAMDQVIQDASAYTVAANNDVSTKSIQRKFTSKRALNTRRFSDVDKQEYNEDSAWVGATQKFEERPEAKHSERLNRLFKSRRAFRQ